MRRDLLILTTAVLVGCVPVNCATAIEQAAVDSESFTAAGLPALPDEAAGWRAISDPQRYAGDDLYLYINGGAVTFIECGFRQVATREYLDGSTGRLTLEIFEMSDAGAARCIYQRRAGDGGTALDLGDGGRLYDYDLEFHSGRFLVTLTSLTASEGPLPGLAALAADVAGLLPPTPGT